MFDWLVGFLLQRSRPSTQDSDLIFIEQNNFIQPKKTKIQNLNPK